MTTKKILVKTIFMNILTTGIFAFACTSCSNPMEDIAHGLVYGIADQLVDTEGQQKLKEQQKQQRLDNLLNWNMGCEVDQEAIDKFGYDYCFQSTDIPSRIWDQPNNYSFNPNVDMNDLCLVRCLTYSYATNGYAPYISGLICNRRIASDLVNIFRELYEAKYIVIQTIASLTYGMDMQGLTYAYYYQEDDETIPMAQQQGLAVVLNSEEPLTSDNLAVRLFKERGFTWGGDEPNGNPNYFAK